MIPELKTLRKILTKDKKAMDEPLRLPTRYVTRTPGETLAILLEGHFPGAKINAGP